MKRRFTVAVLGSGLALGLAAVPSLGLDTALVRGPPQVPEGVAGWRLRPTQVSVSEAPPRPAAGPIPEARRSVRRVYPALLPDR